MPPPCRRRATEAGAQPCVLPGPRQGNRASNGVAASLRGFDQAQPRVDPFSDERPLGTEDRVVRGISDRVVGASGLRPPHTVELCAEGLDGGPGAYVPY